MQEDNSTVPQQPEVQQPQEADKPADVFKTYFAQIAIGILIAAAIGIAIYRYYGSSMASKQEAVEKLFSAKSTQDLELLLKNNPSSQISPLALLKLAKVQFNSGNYDMALSKYVEFKTKYADHELADAAEMGKLHCMEARSQTQEALAGFTAFASTKTNHFLYAEAVMGQARCLEQQGRQKEAVAVYEDFIAAHPDSVWSSKIEDLLAALKKKLEEKKSSG